MIFFSLNRLYIGKIQDLHSFLCQPFHFRGLEDACNIHRFLCDGLQPLSFVPAQDSLFCLLLDTEHCERLTQSGEESAAA